MSIDVANESEVPVDNDELVRTAEFVMAQMGVHPLAELSVVLVDGGPMAELHERWMNESGPTDVMAFPQDEMDVVRRPGPPSAAPMLLGDVVLCPEVAIRQAAAAKHTLADELDLLLTHGILHLLGFDHATAEQEREMFGLQGELLTTWRKQRRKGRR